MIWVLQGSQLDQQGCPIGLAEVPDLLNKVANQVSESNKMPDPISEVPNCGSLRCPFSTAELPDLLSKVPDQFS